MCVLDKYTHTCTQYICMTWENKVSFILTRGNFRNVTVTFLDDTPSTETLDNHYANLCQRYINLPASSSQNSDLNSLCINKARRQKNKEA